MDPEWRPLSPEISDTEVGDWLRRLPVPVAVTGATGFVGSHLAESLAAANVPLRLLVRDSGRLAAALVGRADVAVVEGSLGSPAALRELVRGAGTVLHVAGLVRAPAEKVFDAANRVGTANVVEALRAERTDAALVYVSSLAAAGPSPTAEGRAPTDPPAPISAYGRSKLAGELAVRAHSGRWAIVRPPAVYGPRDIDILQFFRLAARGWVPVPAGHRWVTVAHVSDVVRGILAAAAASGDGRIWHLGEPFPHTMRGLIESLAAAGDVRARTVGVPSGLIRFAGEIGNGLQRLGMRTVAMTGDKARELTARHWTSASAESLRELGIGGFVPFSAGARATWRWYRDHGWVPRVNISPREPTGA